MSSVELVRKLTDALVSQIAEALTNHVFDGSIGCLPTEVQAARVAAEIVREHVEVLTAEVSRLEQLAASQDETIIELEARDEEDEPILNSALYRADTAEQQVSRLRTALTRALRWIGGADFDYPVTSADTADLIATLSALSDGADK